MPGEPVKAETRARAIELMREGWGRNRIARELGISGGSVTRIAADAGHAFDWRQTEIATRAQQISNAELRERLAQIALLRALDAADAMDAPAEMYHYQPATEHDDGGWKSKTLDAPTFSDQRNLATIFGIMTSKAAELSRASSAAGDAGAISFVETLAAGMQAAAEAMKAAGDDPATDPTIEPTNVSKESLLAEYADAQDDPES